MNDLLSPEANTAHDFFEDLIKQGVMSCEFFSNGMTWEVRRTGVKPPPDGVKDEQGMLNPYPGPTPKLRSHIRNAYTDLGETLELLALAVHNGDVTGIHQSAGEVAFEAVALKTLTDPELGL